MRLRSYLTYSNVIAAVALFIALGGISYAATKLPKNSVGTKQIKNKAVTKAKFSPKLIKQLKGKAGPDGKNKPPLKVLNADGSVLGILTGTSYIGGTEIFEVLIDGGVYPYLPSGQLYPSIGGSPVFRTSSCDGTAYITADPVNYGLVISKLVGGLTRIPFRTISGGTLGPILAWELTATHETVAAVNAWQLDNSTGACVPGGTVTGELVTLEPVVPAPPDGVGPLKISS